MESLIIQPYSSKTFYIQLLPCAAFIHILHVRHVRAPLTLYGHIKTAEQRAITQQYGDWYTGR